MLGTVLKVGVPLVAAGLLLTHSTAPGLAAGPIGLTNVTGHSGDCAAPTTNAVCAPLFDGHEMLWPGRKLAPATVEIGYHGSQPASVVGLYVSRFETRTPGSGASCTAPDPASTLDLSIDQGGQTIYQGTLSDFASAHGAARTLLPLRAGHDGSGTGERWQPGDSSTFSFTVGLDASAGNSYMGCVSSADLTWLAQ
ncbi:MAG TPA: hypothetical protein VF134_09160 [Candidatus Dormibacteraeota bacterium]